MVTAVDPPRRGRGPESAPGQGLEPAPGRCPASGRIRHAIVRALPIFFSARLLAVVFVPLLLAAIAWVVVAAWAWDPFVQWLARTAFQWSGKGAELLAGVMAAVAFLLAAVTTALVAIALLAMPVIVRLVAQREYPALERRSGGTFAGSALNALGATLSFIALWLLALPLLIFPPAYIVANMLLNANLNRKLLPYDALAEHADRDELEYDPARRTQAAVHARPVHRAVVTGAGREHLRVAVRGRRVHGDVPRRALAAARLASVIPEGKARAAAALTLGRSSVPSPLPVVSATTPP